MTEDIEVIDDDEWDDEDEEGEECEEDEEGVAAALAGFDLGGLLAQAESMQRQLLDARVKAAETTVEGQAGGGVVRIRMNGSFEVQEVVISPDVVDPAEVEMLQDLVVAALRDALMKVEEVNARSIGGLGAALGGLGP